MLKNSLRSVLEFAYPIYSAYAVITSFLPVFQQLAVFLSLTLALVFLKYPTFGKESKVKTIGEAFDWVLILLSFAVGGYIFFMYAELVQRVGLTTAGDVTLGVLAILLVLEATRRSAGWPLTIIAICSLLYSYFIAGFSVNRMIMVMYLTMEGIFGMPLAVMMRFVVVFILFGAVMESIGGIDFIMKLSQIIAGRWRSGPAQIAVVSSGLMGSISGSAVANVVTTGSMTIPMMKRMGYHPNTAGAIESAASTGGQIMPPVMGAAAFLMAEMLGVSYLHVMKAALIPAVLYYLSVGTGVYFYAEKAGVQKIDRSTLPAFKEFARETYYVLPLLLLVYYMISGSSPVRAAFYAILAGIVISFLRKTTRFDHRKLHGVCKRSSYNIADISAAAACAGIVIGALMSTGLTLKFSSFLVYLSGGNLILCLLLTMLASILFGMGLPTTITYLILAVLIVPSLMEMNVLPIAGHMFIFFFGMMSMVTPPVAFAVYAAVAIARSDFMKTGLEAFRLVFPTFIIAYVFIYDNSVLFIGDFSSIAWSFVKCMVGVVSINAATLGYFLRKTTRLQRGLFFAGGFLLIVPGILWDLLGVALTGIGILSQFLDQRRHGIPERRFQPVGQTPGSDEG